MENKLTQEQQENINERVKSFKMEYENLIKKYECDFLTYPVLIPKEDGSFAIHQQMQIVDRKYAPILSPIQPLMKDK